ncbi:ESCRT-III subunit protein snf7 [Ciborinia camelliae]|nr:ESCRT-III subunit protein snf7 [Ciborinia camelliae]
MNQRRLIRLNKLKDKEVQSNKRDLYSREAWAWSKAIGEKLARMSRNEELAEAQNVEDIEEQLDLEAFSLASGSPEFQDLISSNDAFTVELIGAARGGLIGKTNMPSMAYGDELADLEQEQLDNKMLKTGSVPVSDEVHRLPSGLIRMEFRKMQMWDIGVVGNRTNGKLYQPHGTQRRKEFRSSSHKHRSSHRSHRDERSRSRERERSDRA